jgi:hypothetical protein
MKYTALFALLLCLGIITGAASCRKTQKGPPAEGDTVATTAPKPENTEKKLLELYRSGEIDRCKDAQGNTVYRCQKNIRDIETRIYDAMGAQVGVCFYSTNKVDAICRETTGCTTIYRVDKNIWGKPAVNLIEK